MSRRSSGRGRRKGAPPPPAPPPLSVAAWRGRQGFLSCVREKKKQGTSLSFPFSIFLGFCSSLRSPLSFLPRSLLYHLSWTKRERRGGRGSFVLRPRIACNEKYHVLQGVKTPSILRDSQRLYCISLRGRVQKRKMTRVSKYFEILM